MSITEIWHPVVGYEGLYEVSNLGVIRSLGRCKGQYGALRDYSGRFLSLKNGKLYVQVVLVKEGKKKGYLVHRLVAMAFIPNPQELPEVNHINGRKRDNRAENLEWVDSSQNQHHSYKLGLQQVVYGEGHHRSKLTEAEVIEIRRRFKNGESHTKIAPDFGVHRRTIVDVCLRKTWSHI